MSGAVIEFTAPIETRAETNRRDGHWAQRKRRVEKQRGDFRLCFMAHIEAGTVMPFPMTVTFTRIAPRALDPGDNLNSAFKACRDELAALLGFNDNTDRVMWRYEQERGKPRQYAIRVRIESSSTTIRGK